MRLIDADALVYSRVRIAHEDGTIGGYNAVVMSSEIKHAPTIDAVPIKHGKWIDETFEPWGLVHHPYKCNLCGEHAEFASPYCPNCGARMDEE